MVPIQCRKIVETFLLFLVHWCDNWMYSDSASHQLYTKEIYNGMCKILGIPLACKLIKASLFFSAHVGSINPVDTDRWNFIYQLTGEL